MADSIGGPIAVPLIGSVTSLSRPTDPMAPVRDMMARMAIVAASAGPVIPGRGGRDQVAVPIADGRPIATPARQSRCHNPAAYMSMCDTIAISDRQRESSCAALAQHSSQLPSQALQEVAGLGILERTIRVDFVPTLFFDDPVRAPYGPCDPVEILRLIQLLSSEDWKTRTWAEGRLKWTLTFCGDTYAELIKLVRELTTDDAAAEILDDLLKYLPCAKAHLKLVSLLDRLSKELDAYHAEDRAWKDSFGEKKPPTGKALQDSLLELTHYIEAILRDPFIARCFFVEQLSVLSSILKQAKEGANPTGHGDMIMSVVNAASILVARLGGLRKDLETHK